MGFRRPAEQAPRASSSMTVTATGSIGLHVALAISLIGTLVIPISIASAQGSSEGPCSTRSYPTPSASGSPSPTASAVSRVEPAEGVGPGTPSIQLLNPINQSSPVKVSDEDDGVDERAHIAAAVADPPPNALVEAYFAPTNGNERSIGVLCPSLTDPEIYDLYWDIPEGFPTGAGSLLVRLFDSSAGQNVQLGADAVAVDVQPSAATTELTWPDRSGRLGFYKGQGASTWTTTVDGIATPSTTGFRVLYMKSSAGGDPEFVLCDGSQIKTRIRTSDNAVLFTAGCELKIGDSPSAVSAVAVMTGAGSSDAHKVQTYVQRPADFQVNLSPASPSTATTKYPTGMRRVASDGCLTFRATVLDGFQRPVQNVNLDARIEGPNDSVQFGAAATTKAPDTSAAQQNASNCSGAAAGKQTYSIVPNGNDPKYAESASPGTNYLGEWPFSIYSDESGFTDITVWVDDADAADETTSRPPDDDVESPEEAAGTARAQWLDGAVRLDIGPKGTAAQTNTCYKLVVDATGGDSVLAGYNVDVHARVPDGVVQTCDVGGSSSLEPPNSNHDKGPTHAANATDPVTFAQLCPGAGPPCQHLEGTTDEEGRLVIGLTSAAAGPASITVWPDGEPGADDDMQVATAEPGDTAPVKFVSGTDQVSVRLLSPSGSSPLPTTPRIGSSSFDVVARVDAPSFADSLGVYVAPSSTGRYVRLGEAERVGMTDTFVYRWDLNEPLPGSAPGPGASPSPTPTESRPPRPNATPTPDESPTPTPTPLVSPSASVSSPPPPPGTQPTTSRGVADGSYKVRVIIEGSSRSSVQTVDVSRAQNVQSNDNQAPWEWVTISSPKPGVPVAIPGRSLSVAGVASAGAEGVDLFYSKSGPSEVPVWQGSSGAQTRCGFVSLTTSTSPQSFSGTCTLADGDKATQITAVGAVAWNCQVGVSGCANPTPGLGQIGRGTTGGQYEQSASVPVLGCSSSECLVLQPLEMQRDAGTCQAFEALVGDENGEPIAGVSVDVMLKGPGDGAGFCSSTQSTLNKRRISKDPNGPDVLYAEGTTDATGTLAFGIVSKISGYSTIYSTQESRYSSIKAWLDDGNNELDEAEVSVGSVMHWLLPGRCTVVGTTGDDILAGTVDADKICGRGGDDTIYGYEGNDVFLGGAGDDEIYGDPGRDRILGQNGDDLLFGGPGNDRLDGGPGRNSCPDGRKADELLRCLKSPP